MSRELTLINKLLNNSTVSEGSAYSAKEGVSLGCTQILLKLLLNGAEIAKKVKTDNNTFELFVYYDRARFCFYLEENEK